MAGRLPSRLQSVVCLRKMQLACGHGNVRRGHATRDGTSPCQDRGRASGSSPPPSHAAARLPGGTGHPWCSQALAHVCTHGFSQQVGWGGEARTSPSTAGGHCWVLKGQKTAEGGMRGAANSLVQTPQKASACKCNRGDGPTWAAGQCRGSRSTHGHPQFRHHLKLHA